MSCYLHVASRQNRTALLLWVQELDNSNLPDPGRMLSRVNLPNPHGYLTVDRVLPECRWACEVKAGAPSLFVANKW